MTLGDLRALFRSEVHDTVDKPYLWSTTEVDSFANDAVLEAVRRGISIIDSTTPQICNIAYTNNPLVMLDPRIITVEKVIIAGQALPLTEATAAWMDMAYPGWLTATEKYPSLYVLDYTSNMLRLSAIPTAPGTLNLSVLREPLKPLAEDGDIPEIPARYHRGLVHRMVYLAYSKDDTEAEKTKRGSDADKYFTAEFGERKSARNEHWSRRLHAFADTLC